ncbi:hypothetical protein [Desulfosporosinus meridiei]|uniref:Uncharacterized protein n=1 Tax=Desulfosporosinus meridiei (strain ATCC BAA-275 / DSM 13257 / KCTC 12902 / NCIMB 13706 / S10) TaxID=768704 RepID=J7J1U0_DESMD|nr:hypothetical protein [Desulfosporosinus meridiei]AFQ46289.1 hypothetical protein Desmer_4483 [Desulfosporosinus meridiei DSM 13257]
MTCERFFKHLETCGGCTGQRDKTKCQFAIVCAYVEKLFRKGVIKSSKDFCYRINGSDLMFNTIERYLSRAAAINQTVSAGIGLRKAN